MQKEYLCGRVIPYDKPISKLKELLLSSRDIDFRLACEALSRRNDQETYELLKSILYHKDEYRIGYVLPIIFQMPQSSELFDYLCNSLSSDNSWIAKSALEIVGNKKIQVSDEILRSAIFKNLHQLDKFSIYALSTLTISENNFNFILFVFLQTIEDKNKEVLCRILLEKYLSKKPKELFELFKKDSNEKIRLEALKIGIQFGFDTDVFLNDVDENIRKIAYNSRYSLSFLSEYKKDFKVHILDASQNAIITNPYGNNNIRIEYKNDGEHDPFTVRFSYQHRTFSDEQSIKEWINKIISGELFAIGFFKNNNNCYSGEISKEEVESISYVSLMDLFGKTIYQNSDECRIRGWLRNSDINYTFSPSQQQIMIKE